MKQPTRKIKDARKYTAKDWLEFGDVPDPTTREKMILLAIEQIRDVGPVDFNALEVCQRLDVKAPMVNYYFGNRDGFLAEVSWWVYQQWNKKLIKAFRSADKNPRARLRAWMDAELECARHIGGMYVLMQYPLTSQHTLEILVERYSNEMNRLFEYLLAMISVCIRDIDRGTLSELDFDADSIPRKEFLVTPQYVGKAIEMAWALNGLALWHSGRHVPTIKLEGNPFANLTREIVVKNMLDSIMLIVEPRK